MFNSATYVLVERSGHLLMWTSSPVRLGPELVFE